MSSLYIIDYIGYHYIINNESTTTNRNSVYQYDRLNIELLKIEKYKELGVFDIPEFYNRTESQFISLFYLNSLYIFFTRFDRVLCDVVNFMKDKLKEIFPKWYENEKIKTFNKREMALLGLVSVDRALTQDEVDSLQYAYLCTLCGKE